MRIRLVPLLQICLLVPVAVAGIGAAKPQPDTTSTIRLPVHLNRAVPPGTVSFAVSLETETLTVLSASPTTAAQPLLLIIDPASYSIPELQRRLTNLVAGLNVAHQQRPLPPIRVGLLVFDGILLDLPALTGPIPESLTADVLRFAVQVPAEEAGDPGRILDLAGSLISKATADGQSMDCLLIGKERSFPATDAEYFRLSSERRLLEICRRSGSVLHAYLDGAGQISSACAATGGMIFGPDQPPDAVVRRILEARDQTFVITVQLPAVLAGLGRHALTVRMDDREGNPLTDRAPSAVWLNPAGVPAPDRESVREALEWHRRAQSSAGAGDYRVALRFAENAFQLDPCNPQTAWLGAHCSFELGDLAAAEDFVSKALRFLHPTERLLLLYGEIFRKTGKSAQALEAIQALPHHDVPKSAEFRLMMARLLASAGREGEAEKLYSTIVREGHSDSQVAAEYGSVLWKLGNEGAAAAQIEAALAADPQNIAAMICAMDMAAARGQNEKAQDLGVRAARLQPSNPDVHLQIGRMRVQAHDLDAALESYRAAAELAPARSDILLQLAEAQLRSGQSREARETVGKILILDASHAATYESIAGIYARAGSFDNAASLLEEGASRLSDQAPSLYRSAAALRERRGQYGQALLDYRASSESLPAAQADPLRSELSQHLRYLSLMLGSSSHSEKEKSGAANAPTAADSPMAVAPSDMVLRGGLQLLANILGVAPASLHGAGGTGRAFAAILDSIPRSQAKELSQVQAEIVESRRQYESLVGYLEQQHLKPAGKAGSAGQELVFPLAGDAATIQRAKTLLSFFGVKYSYSTRGGKIQTELSYKTDRTSTLRQRLLRRMGTDIQAKNLKEIRLSLRDETLPTILDAAVLLNKLLNLPITRGEDLFESFVLNPGAMTLYRALEDCRPTLRETLVQVLTPKELAELKVPLSEYGRFLDVKQGHLVLPGSLKSWESLVKTSSADAGAFLRAFVTFGKGKLLFTCFALQAALPEVQKVITNSTGGLETIAGLDPPLKTGLTATDWKADFVRIMRMLSTDAQGLFLPVPEGFARYLLPGKPGPQAPQRAPGYRPLRMELKDLPGLLQPRARTENAAVRTAAGIVEFLSYLQLARPRILTSSGIDALGRNLVNAPAFVDLVWSLDPPADLLVQYLDYFGGLLDKEVGDWKGNGLRTSQAIVLLLSLLQREGTIDLQTGRSLLASALESFQARDETEFLVKTSGYLTEKILPVLRPSGSLPAGSADVLLEALAGRHPPQLFLFDGTPIVQGDVASNVTRMQSSIRPQRICPLPDILSAIRPLMGYPKMHDGLLNLAESTGKLSCAAPASPIGDSAPKRATAQDLTEVAGRLASVLKAQRINGQDARNGPPAAIVSQLVQQISGMLNTELGVALLAYGYAYYGAPQIAALSYNEDFVRNHDFLASGRAPRAYWPSAELEAGSDRRGVVKGLLSGLGIQMQQLEIGPSAQGFGKEPWNRLVPEVLSAMRAQPVSSQSDRAQEFVALSVRLGRELLALQTGTPPAAGWFEQSLRLILPPPRGDLVKSLLARGRFQDAAEAFAPSELFLLGESFLLSSGTLPAGSCSRLAGFTRPEGAGCGKELLGKSPPLTSPTLERLRKIIPPDASADLERFQDEVEQYGFFMWHRTGLAVNSFHYYEQYEQLQFPATMEMLFDRINDIKIQLAEISYAAGLPATLSELLGDMALQRLITDPAAAGIQSWRDVVDQITKLSPDLCRGWIEELLNTGALAVYSGKGP